MGFVAIQGKRNFVPNISLNASFFTNKQKKSPFSVPDSASRGSYVIYEHSKAENMSGVGNFGCGKYQNDTKSDFVIFLTKNPSFYPPNNYQ